MRPRLRATGITLCVVGGLLLTFVAYQLWGTSFLEHAAQNRLRTELESQLHHRSPRTTPPSPPAATAVGADTLGAPSSSTSAAGPAEGQPVGFLSIPRIGLNDDVIIEGVGDGDLRQGPGHYPGTPLPGQPGNAAIAGHRTTYAAPFYNLNELQIGDPIVVRTVQGTFHYAVLQTEIVAPTDSAVLDNTAASELTLTTCNPRYSASQRLVVVALLQQPRTAGAIHDAGPVHDALPVHHAASTPRTAAAALSTASDLGGSGGGGGVGGLVLWGFITAAAAILAVVMWRRPRRRVPRWLTGLVGAPAVVVGLFVFYGHLSAILPASF